MRYKHFDVVVAYMSGEIIQYKSSDGEWCSVERFDKRKNMPLFHVNVEYRIKPKDTVVRKHLEYGYDPYRDCGYQTQRNLIARLRLILKLVN